MGKCDILAISNSSFSFAASMLNESAHLFLRPHLLYKKLIPFDPWDSEILLTDDKPLQEALKHFREKNFEQLKNICTDLLETHPMDVFIMAKLCQDKYCTNNTQMKDFSNIKELASQQLGYMDYYTLGEYNVRLLQIDPDNVEAKNFIYELYNNFVEKKP